MTPEQKEYKDQGNYFANWLTAIIISNYAYLVRLMETDQIAYLPKKMWDFSFTLTNWSLILIFFHKGLGVVAARLRINKQSNGWLDKQQANIEVIRSILILVFVGLGVMSLIASGEIIKLIFEAKET